MTLGSHLPRVHLHWHRTFRPSIDPFYRLARRIAGLIAQHQAIALGGVIGLEELGVPLPVPGDVFILYAGDLVARGKLAFWPAVASIVVSATIGASILYWIARRLGSNLVLRYGGLIHLDAARLARTEVQFNRYGLPLIVVGRWIPGLRIVFSILCGLLRVRYPVFAMAVAISSFVWATVLLLVGEHLGKHVRAYLHVGPGHLLPRIVFFLLLIVVAAYIWYRRRRARQERGAGGAAPPAGAAESGSPTL